MSSRLAVSFAGHLSDRLAPLYHGTVRPDGIDLAYIPLQPYEAFPRMLRGEFDTSEMSFSSYVLLKAKGECPLVAIPVFPSRTFRHSAIYVREAAGINAPADLKEQRIGVPEYTSTAIVWARGMLKDEYGVEPQDIRWVTGGLREAGRIQKFKPNIPGVAIEHVSERSLDEMIRSGELDGIIAPQAPPSFRAGDAGIRRLFPNYVEVEREYYKKTSIFPIMHVVVIREELHARHPWVAASLYNAFLEAKQAAIESLLIDEPLPVSLPWSFEHANSVRAVMGDDFWPYGVEKNMAAIEALCRYSFDQKLSPRKVEVEELFASNVLALPQHRL